MVRIFWTIKTPDERATTKQACRDESIVSLFFFRYRNIYRALLLRIEHCKTEKSIHRLPIYIYIYIYISEDVEFRKSHPSSF